MAGVLAAREEYRTQQWAMLIRECKPSGMRNKDFCIQRGVSEKSFYYRQRKLRTQIVEACSCSGRAAANQLPGSRAETPGRCGYGCGIRDSSLSSSVMIDLSRLRKAAVGFRYCNKVYSMAETAKANGMEPFAYLQHVLVQLPYLGKNHSHEELESLMPWSPEVQQQLGKGAQPETE